MTKPAASVRTLLLTNNPNLGSTARILQAWLEIAAAAGVEARVVMRSQGAFTHWLTARGVPALVDPMPFFERREPWTALKHSWLVRRFGAESDVIHCNEHDVYPFVLTLRRFLRLPVVCHVRYRIDRKFAEWAFAGRRCPDALLWTSHQQKKDSFDAVDGIVPEARQHIVPLGIDVTTFGTDHGEGSELRRTLGVSDEEILVGTASPLRPRKRLEDFIEIASRLGHKYARTVFIIAGGEIAGDEGYRHEIERRIEHAGLGRRLRWVGFLEPVEPFHHATDISVSTSEYETFGNSVCEAMACGKPVAAYRGGSVDEVLGGAGLIVDTCDLDGLTAAVERLILHPQERAAFGALGRERVGARFSPAASLRQVVDIYSSLLPPAAPAG